MNLRTALRRPRTWLIAVPVIVFIVAVAGPFVYINFIEGDPPERLTFTDTASATGTDGGTETDTAESSLDGTWSVAGGSQAGYRVGEVLFGQDTEAVGRTSDIIGQLVVDGTTIESASFAWSTSRR